MSSFIDYAQRSRNQVIPHCPQCGLRDHTILIDSTKDDSQLGTMPVWHCGKCDKVFGQRTTEVEASVTGSHFVNTNSVNSQLNEMELAKRLAGLIVNGSSYDLVMAIQDLTKKVWRDHHQHDVDRKIAEAGSILKLDIEARLKAAVEIEQDSLTAIRRRVASFVLR